MPIYTVVVKAENIEEHADTTPPSLNIYPVGINLENPHDNSKHKGLFVQSFVILLQFSNLMCKNRNSQRNGCDK